MPSWLSASLSVGYARPSLVRNSYLDTKDSLKPIEHKGSAPHPGRISNFRGRMAHRNAPWFSFDRLQPDRSARMRAPINLRLSWAGREPTGLLDRKQLIDSINRQKRSTRSFRRFEVHGGYTGYEFVGRWRGRK